MKQLHEYYNHQTDQDTGPLSRFRHKLWQLKLRAVGVDVATTGLHSGILGVIYHELGMPKLIVPDIYTYQEFHL